MAYTGPIIHNPVSGERITFLQTSRDTNGEKLEIELSPDGHVPAPTCTRSRRSASMSARAR
jgi:hypothetical protein